MQQIAASASVFNTPRKAMFYRVNAGSCVNPPISRFDGVNKTVGGAKKTIAGVNKTVERANRTVDRAKKNSGRATETIGAANRTFGGANGIVSRVTNIVGGAKICSMHRHTRHRHQEA
jgi:hypothetical protein